MSINKKTKRTFSNALNLARSILLSSAKTKIRDVQSHAISENESYSKAIHIMNEKDVGSVFIVDKNFPFRIKGLLTETQYLIDVGVKGIHPTKRVRVVDLEREKIIMDEKKKNLFDVAELLFRNFSRYILIASENDDVNSKGL